MISSCQGGGSAGASKETHKYMKASFCVTEYKTDYKIDKTGTQCRSFIFSLPRNPSVQHQAILNCHLANFMP